MCVTADLDGYGWQSRAAALWAEGAMRDDKEHSADIKSATRAYQRGKPQRSLPFERRSPMRSTTKPWKEKFEETNGAITAFSRSGTTRGANEHGPRTPRGRGRG